MCVHDFFVILHIVGCLECCMLLCVMCVIILYCPVLHCSTLPPGINPLEVYYYYYYSLTHTHTQRKCSITHSSVATMASNRKKMDNESVREILAPDRKMDTIMYDVTMKI